LSDNNSFPYYLELQERVISAYKEENNLFIMGGGSKEFYGRKAVGDEINVRPCHGVIFYEPTELVITARTGTPLSEIENVLAGENQQLAFEPPHFGKTATLGGMVACGLSGPRRPYAGPVRDYVLGIKCMNGRGEILSFGGQVMKNVAGYDVSRLMTGALGTLGILLEVSLKVLPIPENEVSLTMAATFTTAINLMNTWAGMPLPISAMCFENNNLNIRLSGNRNAIITATRKLAMEEHPDGVNYWQNLKEHKLDFFNNADNYLWRISTPSATGQMNLSGEWLIEWGGSQRWLKSSEPIDRVRKVADDVGGHATLFKGGGADDEIFHPLSAEVFEQHDKLKIAFDPKRILNIGRMYKGL